MVPTRLYETAVTRDQNPMHFGGKKTVVAIGKQRSLPIDINLHLVTVLDVSQEDMEESYDVHI